MKRLLFVAALLLSQPLFAADTRAIVGAALVDVVEGRVIPDAVVVIREGRIAAAGPAAETPVPDDAERIDLEGKWLVPGLMNMHVHLGLILPGLMAAEHATESDAQLVLRMAENARKSLYSGVTTIRQPGDRRHADIALARATDRGVLPGPRIVSSGEMINITGGHGASMGTHFDGPYEMRKAARLQVRAGAQWLKIAISGGIATPVGGIGQGLMTADEISAVVDIAERHGIKVTAHSGSDHATREAVELGVHGVEHGYFLQRPTLRLMAERGTWYVPTIVVSQPASFDFFERIGSPPWYMARVYEVGQDHWRALEMAVEEGVNIALGTDQFPYEPNDGTTATVREAEYYVEAGMTPLQALRSATLESARMLGMDDTLGSLSVGKHADIVAIEGNPLEDISALRSLGFVMKGGQVFRHDWRRIPPK